MIINKDCLEYMKTLPDKYFDLVITDPPYGIDAANYKRANTQYGNSLAKCKDYGNSDWDKNIPSEEVFKEIFRVSKNQIIFGGNYMTDYLPPSSCWIVWDKKTGDNGYADCELAWTSFNKAVRKFEYMWKGFIQEQMNWKEDRFHPTQKPVALGRWLIEKYAKKGDKIFDPFAGSGSFLVACYQLGYDFVGCEISKEYCEIINKRLQQRTLLTIQND